MAIGMSIYEIMGQLVDLGKLNPSIYLNSQLLEKEEAFRSNKGCQYLDRTNADAVETQCGTYFFIVQIKLKKLA